MAALKESKAFGLITPSLKWVVALIWLVIALFPIYWIFNVVFSAPDRPVALYPCLYPTSISAGIGILIATTLAQHTDTGLPTWLNADEGSVPSP